MKIKKISLIMVVLLFVTSFTACNNEVTTDDTPSSNVEIIPSAEVIDEEKSTVKNHVPAIYSDEEDSILIDTDWLSYDEEYLTTLKDKYELSALVVDSNTDMEKIIAITTWVSSLWEHDGMNVPEQSDPIYILDQVTENGERFRCVEYGVVIDGCLQALGIPSRSIALKTADVEIREFGAGHVATEAYLSEYEKWVFIDGQFGIIPMLADIPLNAVELGEAIANDDINLTLIKLLNPNEPDEYYYRWIEEYIYYLDVNFNKGGEIQRLMLVPIGAPKPTIFQIEYELNVDIYTNSKTGFYPKIK